MLIELICVARRPPVWLSEARQEYARRLPRTFALEFVHINPARDAPSATQRRHEEGARVLKRVASTSPLIALEVNADHLSSTGLARKLDDFRGRCQRLAIVIGGADGLDEAVISRAVTSWSVSRLTLPHQLMQLLMAEQIYRAWTILEGHPYHRA